MSRCVVAGIATTALLVAACGEPERVVVPTADSTPPTLAMSVFGLPQTYPGASSGQVITRPGDAEISGKVVATAQLTFAATASDAESGFGYMAIRGETDAACEPPGELAVNRHATWNKPWSEQVVPGGSARTTVNLSLEVSIDDLIRCAQGVPFGVQGTFHAEARNNLGETVSTGEVTFFVSSPS
jgi:hypothetical protein